MNTRVPTADAHRPYRSRRSTSTLTAIVFAALVLSGPGCTTTQTLYPQAAAPENALAGATVTVITNDGRSVRMKVVESSAESLAGRDSSGQLQVFRLEEIQSIRVAEFSAGKTALLAAGIVVIVGILALAADGFAVYPDP